MVGKGQYNSETQYSPLDIVSFNGGSYLAKQASINHQPMLDSQDDYWQLIAAPGAGAPVIDDNDYLSWTGADSISIENTIYEYALSENGQTPPSTWQSTIPSIQDGMYLWTRNTIKLNIGDIITYTVAYQGKDGDGVNTISVNNIDPVNGNILLQASDIFTNSSISVQTTLDNLSYSISNIIESVKMANGRYIKYASGDMVCMNHISGLSMNYTNLTDSGLRFAEFNNSISGFIEAAKWPQTFIEKPYISVTPSGNVWDIIGYLEYDETGITTIGVARPDGKKDTVNLDINCIAYGRWK